MNAMTAAPRAVQVPDAPEFGGAVPAAGPSGEMLARLAHRRSASAATLAAPAPTGAELDDLLRLAARTPDHGKLFPWRFIVLEGAGKAAFVAELEAIAETREDAAKAVAALGKIRIPPLSVVVVSRVSEGKIPEWEQVLSAGAVCMGLLLAADAMGYGANWITDWYAYDERATALLGLANGERVAGYIHVGTAAEAPLERVRPDLAQIAARWSPPPR